MDYFNFTRLNILKLNWRHIVLSFFLFNLCLPSLLFAKTLGNPAAKNGGDFKIGFPAYPKSLLYYLAQDDISYTVNDLIFETLVEYRQDTNEPAPRLAAKWKISKDKRLFTFFLNPKAKFADGKAVTAEDVKFTWDVLNHKNHKTVVFQNHFRSIESCKVIDERTVQFKARTVHFKNFNKIASDLFILPKHFFSKGNFNKSFKRKLLGSGPYLLHKVKTGRGIFLNRHSAYWGAHLSQNIGRYNFDAISFKVVPDQNIQFQMFKKGELDYFYFHIAKMWKTQTDSFLFKNNYVKKLKGENLLPFRTQGIAWNIRLPLFHDRRVRRALSHLLNISKINQTLFYNSYRPSSGVISSLSPYHSPQNKATIYNPLKAKKLLEDAGWKKLGSDGVLTKELPKGSILRFEFDVLTSFRAAHKYLSLYQEDLRKMGIKMNIRTVDWATRIKLINDRNFEAVEIARNRSIHPSDFLKMWGSKQADRGGSANITGYQNAKLDELAEKIDQTFDPQKRIPLVRKIDRMIASDHPVLFTWESKFFRVAYWNKFSFPGKAYFNYSNESNAFQYWWYDKDKDEKLTKARQSKKPLAE